MDENGYDESAPLIQINRGRFVEILPFALAGAQIAVATVFYTLFFMLLSKPGSINEIDFGSLLAVIATFASTIAHLLKFFFTRDGKILKNERTSQTLKLLYPILCIIGCCCYTFIQVSPVFIVIAYLLLSWLSVSLFFQGCITLSNLPQNRILRYTSISITLGIALSLLFQYLLVPIAAILFAFLYLSLSPTITERWRITKDAQSAQDDFQPLPSKIPTIDISSGAFLFGLSLGAFAAISNFGHVFSFEASFTYFVPLSLFVGSLAIFAYSFIRTDSIYKLPQWSCFIAGGVIFIILPLLQGKLLCALFCILVAVYAFYTTANIIIAIVLSKNSPGKFLKGLSFNRVADITGLFISTIVMFLIYENSVIDQQTLMSVVSAVGAIVFIAALVLMFRQAFNKWLRVGEDVTKSKKESAQAEKAFRDCCEDLAEQYGLSARERDVFMLLGKGVTPKKIKDELNISYATAKSHVYHIYTKMDVHSHDEITTLIENAMEDNWVSPS